jgi:hypothetical protein
MRVAIITYLGDHHHVDQINLPDRLPTPHVPRLGEGLTDVLRDHRPDLLV